MRELIWPVSAFMSHRKLQKGRMEWGKFPTKMPEYVSNKLSGIIVAGPEKNSSV